MKAKVKRSPRRRYGLWLILGMIIGLAVVLTMMLSLFDIRRDMVFATKKTIFRDSYITYAQWSPDESRILMQTSGADFSTWDAQGNLIQETFLPDMRGFGFNWDPQGTYFTQIRTNGLLIFDKDGNVSADLPHINIQRADWSPAGDRLYTISSDYLAIWRPDGYELSRISISPETYPYEAKWSPDGKYLFTWANGSGTIRDADGQMLHELPAIEGAISASYGIWNHTSSAIIVDRYTIKPDSPPELILQLWNTGGELVWENQFEVVPNNIEWSPDSSHILLNNYDANGANILVLNQDGTLLSTMDTPYHIWQPQGNYMLTMPQSNCDLCEMALRDADGQILQTFPSQREIFSTLPVWSPDGEYFLTWSTEPEDGYFALSVWDKEGNQIHQMLQPTSIRQAIWSPDSQYILTYGGFVAHIYTVNAERVGSLRHAQPIQEAHFNADVSRILTYAQYPVASSREAAIWKIDGTHLATLHTGLIFHDEIVAVNSDFSQVLINKGNHIELRELQAGSIWLDFRWD